VSLFVQGLIVGFCLAAPVGPIAALCVQRTIARSWKAGIVSGLGAAAADGLYGAVAAFGASIISGFLIEEHAWLQRVGGVILILLGLRLLFTRVQPREEVANGNGNGNGNGDPKRRGLTGYFFSTLVLTLTNPMTFVAFAAIFTTLGIGATRGHSILTVELVGGVFSGSALWWTILCALAHAVRHHFDFRKLTVVNRATGVFVIAVGIVYLLLRSTPAPPKMERIERLIHRTPGAHAVTPTVVPTP